jgi:hypothetical protein
VNFVTEIQRRFSLTILCLTAMLIAPACRAIDNSSAATPKEFGGATPLQWSVRMADSETARRSDSLAWRPGRTVKWDLVLCDNAESYPMSQVYYYLKLFIISKMDPMAWIEPATDGLRMRYSVARRDLKLLRAFCSAAMRVQSTEFHSPPVAFTMSTTPTEQRILTLTHKR